ncbi:hypothetical protein [Pseudomonas phage Ppu-503]|nr:hypothetical protein [Pseudomonas phage Ppu-503]
MSASAIPVATVKVNQPFTSQQAYDIARRFHRMAEALLKSEQNSVPYSHEGGLLFDVREDYDARTYSVRVHGDMTVTIDVGALS